TPPASTLFPYTTLFRSGPRGARPNVTARWPADPPHIAQAAERLRAGAVIAFPTDTLYGVGARATDPASVARLYEVKRRPPGQPRSEEHTSELQSPYDLV